jgi:hypothetical protein
VSGGSSSPGGTAATAEWDPDGPIAVELEGLLVGRHPGPRDASGRSLDSHASVALLPGRRLIRAVGSGGTGGARQSSVPLPPPASLNSAPGAQGGTGWARFRSIAA